MENLNSALKYLAFAASLALSVSAFAQVNTDFINAINKANSDYRDDIAKCKDMTGTDYATCMRTAKVTQEAAINAARAAHPDVSSDTQERNATNYADKPNNGH